MLEPELALGAERGTESGLCLAASQGLIEHRLVQLPGPMSAGARQRGSFGAVHPAQMTQFAFESGQTAPDFAEAWSIGKLAEHHGDELLPAGEAAGMALGLVLANGGFGLQVGRNCNSWLKVLDTRFMAGAP